MPCKYHVLLRQGIHIGFGGPPTLFLLQRVREVTLPLLAYCMDQYENTSRAECSVGVYMPVLTVLRATHILGVSQYSVTVHGVHRQIHMVSERMSK